MNAPPMALWLAAMSLLGIGVALAFVCIAVRGPQRPGRRWIVGALTAMAAGGLADVARLVPSPTAWAWSDVVASPALLVIGPCLWMYARAVTGGARRAAGGVDASGAHFVPALAMALTLMLHAATAGHAAGPDSSSTTVTTTADRVALLIVGLHLLAYVGAVLAIVRRARRVVAAHWSSMDGRDLRWLHAASMSLLALVVWWWLAAWLHSALADAAAAALIVGAISWMGTHASQQRDVFGAWRDPPAQDPAAAPDAWRAVTASATPRDADARARAASQASDTTADTPSALAAAADAAKYAKAPLPGGLAAELDGKLDAYMAHEGLYLDAGLTLTDLARALDAKPHHLSQYLSRHRGLSFFDYVNGLRVTAVCAELERPRSARRPMLEIALECGFGSKSAFNAAFRRHAATTPSAFRRRLTKGTGSGTAGDAITRPASPNA